MNAPLSLSLVGVVALGGALGSVARLLVSHLFGMRGQEHWPIFAINLAGALLFGCVLGWLSVRELDDRLRALLATGILGGFTTFSAFTGDALRLLHERRYAEMLVYTCGSVMLGIAFCAAGYTAARAALR